SCLVLMCWVLVAVAAKKSSTLDVVAATLDTTIRAEPIRNRLINSLLDASLTRFSGGGRRDALGSSARSPRAPACKAQAIADQPIRQAHDDPRPPAQTRSRARRP